MNLHKRHFNLYKRSTASLLALTGLVASTFLSTAQAAPGYKSGEALPTTQSQTIWAQNRGVIANDGLDDSEKIQAIIDDIDINNPASNLIRILLPAGEINIGQEIHVDRSGVLIEGAGSNPETGTKIVVNSWKPYTVGSDNAPAFDKKYWPGFAAFRTETRLKHQNEQNYEGSINYHWKHSIEFGRPASIGDTVLELVSNSHVEDKFSVGDLIYVGAANDDAFLDLSEVPQERRNTSSENSNIHTGHMRTQIFTVTAINESTNEVTIDQPLEFDIPIENELKGYDSRMMPVTPVENVGYRNLYITMDNAGTDCAGYNAGNLSDSNPNGVGHRYQNLCAADAIHGIIFKFTHNGFVDNVKLEMTGSHPIVTEFAKNMTFSNNIINGSWNKGAGGNGYFRGSKLYDSLITGNTIENVRHLTLQWSATGNLVENNTLNVDFNLHGGWERNNIIRNNTISVPFEHRSWTNGVPGTGTWQPIWYASGIHASKWAGATGPNNVFLNNTLKKAQTEGASITTWGLFDTPNVEYAFSWDGSGYKHLNSNGSPVTSWTQEIAEAVYAQMPDSGVYTGVISSNDSDNDGVLNNNDHCPNTPSGTTVDDNGCAIIDGDDDNDGVLNSVDLCPGSAAGVSVDENGCEIFDGDDDNDGVANSIDQCPNSANGATVDSNGCALIDGDDDNDGVLNSVDQCPATPAGANVDSDGCTIVDGDDDNDGVLNSVDQCPSTNAGATVDEDGCEIVDGDDDNDGVLNSVDLCPNTAAGVTVDTDGCEEVVVSDCSHTINIAWNARAEITLNGNASCIRFDRDLSGENTQFWDSNANDSCDFRGSITSVDGSGSKTVSGNYASHKGFTGTTLKLTPSNGCSFIKVRAY